MTGGHLVHWVSWGLLGVCRPQWLCVQGGWRQGWRNGKGSEWAQVDEPDVVFPQPESAGERAGGAATIPGTSAEKEMDCRNDRRGMLATSCGDGGGLVGLTGEDASPG